MIDELYDSILSITNETGYLDEIMNIEDKKSLLRWSSNNLFKHNEGRHLIKPNFPLKVFSHDDFFRVPFTCIIKEDGTINNID
jgi:hypothetical protein